MNCVRACERDIVATYETYLLSQSTVTCIVVELSHTK